MADQPQLNHPVRPVVLDKISSLPESSKERAFWEKVLASLNNSAGDVTNTLGEMTFGSYRAVLKIRGITESVQEKIQTASTSIAGGIRDIGGGAIESLGNVNLPQEFYEATKPISSALGSTVNTATAIVKDPLGAPFILANSVTSIIDKISPSLADQLDSSFKSVNLDNLQHLPSKMMGSLRQLATAADALLSVPFEILSDMYNGLLEIMEAIADVIDGIASAVLQLIQKIIFQILDSVLPISEIMSFLDSINELASFVGGISQMVGGFAMVTDITNQITDYSSGFSSFLSNPLQVAASYVPQLQQGLGVFGQVTGALRDPQGALQQFLPPEISQQLQNIGQLPGLGFVGNKGYSVGGILDTLSDGVLTKALEQFPNQAPIVNPLFNQRTESSENEFIQEPYQDAYAPGAYQTNQEVAPTAPITQFVTPAPKIFSEKRAYGITENSKGNVFAPNSSIVTTSNGQVVTAYRFTETQFKK